MSDIKTYRFRGIFFYQDTLVYAEDQKVMHIITETIGTIPKIQSDYSRAVGILYDTGRLPEMFDVILKRDDRNILKRTLNRLFDRQKISGRIVDHLKQHEIMIVLTDFFLLRERWNKHYENYIRKSVSKLRKKRGMAAEMETKGKSTI